MRIRSVVAGCLLGLAACGSGAENASPAYRASPAAKPTNDAAPWARPKDPLKLAREAGLTPARHEFFDYHIHTHLDVFVNGRSVPVPSGIGINIKDPGVQHGPAEGGTSYGGIKECDKPCISPLHTHDFSGVVHVEAPKKTAFNLGQFFEEWDVKLSRTCIGGYCAPSARIAVFVNGTRRQSDPAQIVFAESDEIAIVIGSPPAAIPRGYSAST